MIARFFALVGMGLVFIPLIPSLFLFFQPILNSHLWHDFIHDPQALPALWLTLSSSLGSTLIALILALGLTIHIYLTPHWQRLQSKLSLFLSFPHAAFAIGFAFLIAPSGWLARLCATLLGWDVPPDWITTQDPYAISLTLALAFKESWFLLWILAALLNQQTIQRQITLAQSLGYGLYQIWWQVLLPQLLPRLAWALLAVLAYSLSVVDMALVLAPSTPPTLAVLAWQWLSDPSITMQNKGSLAAFVLLLCLVIIAGIAALSWYGIRTLRRLPNNQRWNIQIQIGLSTILISPFIFAFAAFLLLALWSFAGAWFFPDLLPKTLSLRGWQQSDFMPLWTSLYLGLMSVLIALPLCLLWLESIPSRFNTWLYAPLILPALPLAAAQYSISLQTQLDGTGIAVIWSHLAWVIPYMLLVLSAPFQQFEQRYILISQSLGHSHWHICFKVKYPLLLRPILAACAVGFAVSIAQYLPTLFVGTGKFATVTTEAIALSSGGNRRTLAVQALLQALLPLLAFALSHVLAQQFNRRFQGLK